MKKVLDAAKVADFYSDYYEDGSQARWRETAARDKADHIEIMCREFSSVSVLEVGVGEGAVLAELSNRKFGAELHGVEISDSGLKSARARNIPKLASLQQFDGYTLPFPDKSIDLVYATHVLEHVEHERLFLKELRRVGRVIFLEVPLEDTIRVKGAIHNTIGHINFYNRHTFVSLLESVGLKTHRFESFNSSFATQTFFGATPKAVAKAGTRAFAHAISAKFAEKMFVFNGAAVTR